MTPKERILTTLKHQEPDRVPMGEFAIDAPIFEYVLGRPTFWRARFEADKAYWEGRRDEVVETMITDVIEFYRNVPHDLIPVVTVPAKGYHPDPMKQVGPNAYEAKNGDLYKVATTGHLMKVKSEEPWREYSLDDFPLPTERPERDESQWELVRAIVKEFGDTHFIVARSGDATFPMVGGMERGMVLVAEQPEVVKRVAEVNSIRTLWGDEDWVREGVDGLAPGADYCDTRGPMIAPETIRELFFPFMKEHADAAHRLGVPILKHACGNNWKIMDMLVEAGYDAYQAIQGSATMDIVKLKEMYGDRLTMWGGVDTELLIEGTVDDVKAETRRILKACSPGGGFIMGSSHSLLRGVKPENYLALVEVTAEEGLY